MENQRSRGWAFTINNSSTDDYLEPITNLYEEKEIRYCILADEIGKQGTAHVQGFIMFSEAKSFKKVKKIMDDKAHIEPQKSSEINNILYCMKDDKYHEIGIRPHQGKRTDLEVIFKDLKKGRPILEIAREYPTLYSLYRRAFDAYLDLERIDLISKQDRKKLIVYEEQDYLPLLLKVTRNDPKIKVVDTLQEDTNTYSIIVMPQAFRFQSRLITLLLTNKVRIVYCTPYYIKDFFDKKHYPILNHKYDIELYEWREDGLREYGEDDPLPPSEDWLNL